MSRCVFSLVSVSFPSDCVRSSFPFAFFVGTSFCGVAMSRCVFFTRSVSPCKAASCKGVLPCSACFSRLSSLVSLVSVSFPSDCVRSAFPVLRSAFFVGASVGGGGAVSPGNSCAVSPGKGIEEALSSLFFTTGAMHFPSLFGLQAIRSSKTRHLRMI